MTFRTKVFLIFLITVLASVSLVAYGVTFYTQRAFEQMDMQRTQALEVQFGKEFAQRGIRLFSRWKYYQRRCNCPYGPRSGSAQRRCFALPARCEWRGAEHGLDFMEFVNSDGTLVSSAQYPARVGYKNDWVTSAKNWDSTGAFLRREELPDIAALSLTAVRTQTVGNKTIYIIGGRRLDQNFLASLELPEGMRALLYRNLEPTFVASALTDANGGVPQAGTFQSLIEQIQKQPRI